MINKLILSYIAGLIDADGTIGIYYHINKQRRTPIKMYIAWIQIAQIDSKGIKCIARTFKKHYSYLSKTSKSRRFYRIIFTNKWAYLVAKTLLPYLKIKKSQAKLLLQLEKLKNNKELVKIKRKVITKFGNEHIKIVYRRSKRYMNKLEALRKKANILNGR